LPPLLVAEQQQQQPRETEGDRYMDVNVALAEGEENRAEAETGALAGKHGGHNRTSKPGADLPRKPTRPHPLILETLPTDLNPPIQTAIATSSFSPPPLPSPSPASPCHPPHCRPAPAGRLLPRLDRRGLLGSLPRPSPLPLGRHLSLHSPPAHLSAETHADGDSLPSDLDPSFPARVCLLPRPPAPPPRPPLRPLLLRPVVQSCPRPLSTWTSTTQLLPLPVKNSPLARRKTSLHWPRLLSG